MTHMVYGSTESVQQEPLLPIWWRSLDRMGLAAVVILMLIGLLLSFAASPPLAAKHGQGEFYYVQRHAVYGMASFAMLILISLSSTITIRRVGVGIFVIAFFGILMLPFFGTDFGKGAIRWFSFGFGSIQPSEFLKPGFVVFAAWLMSISMQTGERSGLLISLCFACLIAGILALQPDFGQASLIVFIWCVMYFVSGGPILILLLVTAIVVSAGVTAFQLSDHVQGRILAYLEGDAAPNSQLGYATSAIQEGGLLGVGLGNGTTKFQLPDGHTDFIVAVAAEEYGLVLVVLIIALFGFVCIRSMSRLLEEEDCFVRLSGTGLAALFGIQAFINLGVSVRLLPAKGMTLPLVSYGGSSMIAVGLTLGMLLAVTREQQKSRLGQLFGHNS